MTDTPSSSSLRILQRGDGIVAAEVGPVCVAVWRKDSTIPRFLLQRQALVDVVKRHPQTAGFFCVVEETSGVPGEEVRQASSRMFASLGENLKAVAMVIEGTGFRSALVRSVAAGIVMVMGKRTTPISYVANVEGGADWIEQHVDIGMKPRFIRAVQEARAVLDEPFTG